MDKDQLSKFLLDARTKTYAGDSGKVTPAFKGSFQLEHKEGDWFYRDVYNNGNGQFVGLETIYFKDTPVWSMSYYGNYKKMTEEEIDKILRKALTDKVDEARLWETVKYDIDEYRYICEGYGDVDELGGEETVSKNGNKLYFFYYAGGYIGS